MTVVIILTHVNDQSSSGTHYKGADYITIDGTIHEILMERDEIRDQYWKAFDRFVDPIVDKK